MVCFFFWRLLPKQSHMIFHQNCKNISSQAWIWCTNFRSKNFVEYRNNFFDYIWLFLHLTKAPLMTFHSLVCFLFSDVSFFYLSIYFQASNSFLLSYFPFLALTVFQPFSDGHLSVLSSFSFCNFKQALECCLANDIFSRRPSSRGRSNAYILKGQKELCESKRQIF